MKMEFESSSASADRVEEEREESLRLDWTSHRGEEKKETWRQGQREE